MQLLSIIIPNYNNTHGLENLFKNILLQEIKDFEVIVVDDYSEAPCIHIIEEYRNKGLTISYVKNKKREYTKNTRLNGVEASNGDFITFIDADDVLYGTKALKYHLEMQSREDVDILHFSSHILRNGKSLPLQETCWGTPIAEGLVKNLIYQRYAKCGFGGHTLWGKIIKKQLWGKIISHARNSSVRRYAEDFYLSSLLYFHADSYYGSNRIGYVYEWTDKTNQKAFGRAATYHSMLNEFIPYIIKHGIDQISLERTYRHLIDRVRYYVTLFIKNNRDQYIPPLPDSVYTGMLQHGDADKVLRIIMDGIC